MFDDLFAANRLYQQTFTDSGLAGRAARHLAVLTCIDSRIDPLAMLGLAPGDAKIIRNAGARVTPDALRSLVLAVNLLDVHRVCVVQHTDCAVSGQSEAEIHASIERASGADASSWDFLATRDQQGALMQDIERLRSCELLPSDLAIGGFLFDIRTGKLTQLFS